MHDTLVKMKDGRTFCGPLWEFRPREGYLTIPSDETAPDRIYFKDIESAVTKGERVGVLYDDDGNIIGPRVEDRDLLARAREEGWDGPTRI